MKRKDPLQEYRRRRDFRITPEPGASRPTRRRKRLSFVIQEHHATRLHFDFRLEHEGVLKSWALTREPRDLPGGRILAIATEDHPLDYGKFHGTIPEGEYGAGQVLIWDHGHFEAVEDLSQGLESGKVIVFLHGARLQGRFCLIRVNAPPGKDHWIFFKMKPRVLGLHVPEIRPDARKTRRAA